jgi:putative transposase
VNIPNKQNIHHGGAIGIDLGINRLATLSDGRWFESQKPLRQMLKKVKRLSRDLSRKQKGSANREKARLKLARLHYRIACIRDDILHKITTEIARDYGFVGIETLNVKGMVHNHVLAQALSDAAFGRFTELLKTKVPAAGGVVQPVGMFFPSSKRCHGCHEKRDDLTLEDRVFVCPHCHLECDRDYNASINILQEAMRLFESSPT